MSKKVLLTLVTADGAIGHSHTENSILNAMEWDVEPEEETTQASFTLVENQVVKETLKINGDAWRELEDGDLVKKFIDSVFSGVSMADSYKNLL